MEVPQTFPTSPNDPRGLFENDGRLDHNTTSLARRMVLVRVGVPEIRTLSQSLHFCLFFYLPERCHRLLQIFDNSRRQCFWFRPTVQIC